jgi:AcrR family transcriptional regulator
MWLDIPHTTSYVKVTRKRNTKKPRDATPSRSAAKDASRDALIRAGIELFGAQGLDQPSLDAICERAGYTRGAFYVHFADRDDFIVAVMDRVGTAFLDMVIASGLGADDLSTTMQRFLGAVARGEYPLMAKRGVRPHQLLQACARSPVIRKRYVELVRDSIGRLARTVEAGQDDRRLRSDVDARDVATLLLAAIIGAQTMMELGIPLDAAHAADAFFTMLAPRKGER